MFSAHQKQHHFHPSLRRLGRLCAVVLAFALLATACGSSGDEVASNEAALSASGVDCGLNNGEAATGDPIPIGSVVGETGGDDFSSGADAAQAYFNCINANGGINGRSVEFIIEDDQWNPEVAGQVAAKLVNDDGVVALVGNGSFVEMGVNAQFYEDSNVVSVPAACAVRECFESRNMSSNNAGPMPSNNGIVQYAFDELGTNQIACIGLNIPNNGVWSCEEALAVASANGGGGAMVPLDPGSPDCLGALLEANSGSYDTILMNLPAGLSFCVMGAAEEQDLRDEFVWISPTPLYDISTPDAMGPYWDDKVYLQIELTPFDGTGPDATNWREVMDQYGKDGDRLDTFSQAGYLSAKIVADVLLGLDADSIDRATVTDAIRAVDRYDSDLRCSPWYFGDGDVHQSNHSGQIARVGADGFEILTECFTSPGSFIDEVRAFEEANNLGEFAATSFGG